MRLLTHEARDFPDELRKLEEKADALRAELDAVVNAPPAEPEVRSHVRAERDALLRGYREVPPLKPVHQVLELPVVNVERLAVLFVRLMEEKFGRKDVEDCMVAMKLHPRPGLPAEARARHVSELIERIREVESAEEGIRCDLDDRGIQTLRRRRFDARTVLEVRRARYVA